MKIKVCGITETEQLQRLNDIGVDYAGFIFYHRSPRHVLSKLRSRSVLDLDIKIKKVGVFVNETESIIMDQVEIFGLDLVQLHGHETPTFCETISRVVPVIKAFHIDQKTPSLDWMVQPYQETCSFFLFDTASNKVFGGSGQRFDWDVFKGAEIGKPFFLSGGIAPTDANAVKGFRHRFFYGVDINSRFEQSPGVKNLEQVRDFLTTIKT